MLLDYPDFAIANDHRKAIVLIVGAFHGLAEPIKQLLPRLVGYDDSN